MKRQDGRALGKRASCQAGVGLGDARRQGRCTSGQGSRAPPGPGGRAWPSTTANVGPPVYRALRIYSYLSAVIDGRRPRHGLDGVLHSENVRGGPQPGPFAVPVDDRLIDHPVLGHGPFVFNLSHGIVPETPPEHVARLVELVKGKA